MYVLSLELGLPHPFSHKRVCPPPVPKGGGAHSPAAKGVGESQFQRLEKRLALCLLCGVDPLIDQAYYKESRSEKDTWFNRVSADPVSKLYTVFPFSLPVSVYILVFFWWPFLQGTIETMLITAGASSLCYV